MFSMAILGFGLGSLELGCNALIVSLHSTDKGRYLNLMSVMHGLGSMVAPLYAGWLLAANISWRTVYRWDFVFIGLLIVYFGLTRFPVQESAQSEGIDFKRLGKTAFTAEMLWHYAAITFYVMIELGISSWIVDFLQKVRQQSVLQSTQALALYFGLMMLGRFVGSFLVDRLGYLKSVLVASLGATTCVLLGLFGPPELAVLLPVSGFFLSIIFPTITASASDAHPENLNSVLGLLFTFAGLGGLLGPWLVGLASNWGGISLGFGLNLVFGLLTAISALILMRLRPAVKPA
jgi:fucose permease